MCGPWAVASERGRDFRGPQGTNTSRSSCCFTSSIICSDHGLGLTEETHANLERFSQKRSFARGVDWRESDDDEVTATSVRFVCETRRLIF